ncbi:RDD family protein [soil metagenome]
MQVHVRTTQNVFIHYPVASLGDRILAYLLDKLIVFTYVILMAIIYFSQSIFVVWIWIVTVGLPYLLYHVLFEIFMNGQSPGKVVLKIQVIRLDGTPATVGDFILRWLFAIVDTQLMSGLIAVLCISIGEKGQRLGDMVAGTTVVKLVNQASISAADVFVAPAPDYIPTFPQVVQLNESDIELIRRALDVYRGSGNDQPMMAVTERIKTLLAIQTSLEPIRFLNTVVKDFQHLTSL